MEEKIIDDENYMTQYEKQVIIDQEIDKLHTDLPDYRRPQPSDKYSLEPIKEDEQGKFIHGQKWPLELPDASKKLKSASRPPIRSTIPPRKPRELKSMLFEATIMEFANDEWVDSGIFSDVNEYMTIDIPDSPFKLKIRIDKLKEFLHRSISNGNSGYITFEKGKDKFKVPVEINPQLLLDNEDATLV